MTKALRGALFILLCICFTAIGKEYVGRVIKVADGDTFTMVDARGKKTKVRIYGIDTPEKDQEYGREAGQALYKQIFGKNVRVEEVNIDQYKRVVGKVYLDDLYINLWMIENGHAWFYVTYAKVETVFRDAELQARKKKLGLWKKGNAQEPWLYRKNQRESGGSNK